MMCKLRFWCTDGGGENYCKRKTNYSLVGESRAPVVTPLKGGGGLVMLPTIPPLVSGSTMKFVTFAVSLIIVELRVQW